MTENTARRVEAGTPTSHSEPIKVPASVSIIADLTLPQLQVLVSKVFEATPATGRLVIEIGETNGN